MSNEQGIGLKAGEWVQVRSKEEILATLDANGRLDEMPFMPEMLKYCGARMMVGKRSHKTCDPALGIGTDIDVPCFVEHCAAVAGSQRFSARILFEKVRDNGVFEFLSLEEPEAQREKTKDRTDKSMHGPRVNSPVPNTIAK